MPRRGMKKFLFLDGLFSPCARASSSDELLNAFNAGVGNFCSVVGRTLCSLRMKRWRKKVARLCFSLLDKF